MTAETQEITKKSKKERSKDKDVEKGEKRGAEDDEPIVKRKRKFFKKDKKDKKKEKKDATPKEETIQDDVEPKTEEKADEEHGETEEKVAEDGETEEGPEKKKKGPSKRQLKREKAELRATTAKEASKQEAAQKALNYVSMWKHAKDQWKFNKVKQIWLADNLLDDDYVSDDHFATILEYFEGSKGFARKKLIEKGMKVVKKVEDNIEEDEELAEATEYKRARQLLQALPNET